MTDYDLRTDLLMAGFSQTDTEGLLDFFRVRQLSVVSLNHVGWQSQEDHSLEPLDTDEDFQPPDTVPVYVAGSTAWNMPALDFLEDDSD